ncbi:MAG: type II secretion system minor pseudopilin GspI [Magnetococcales bacterium]|nr:type II secretion system minor pseudopilin GspI [Magnetococcales bacterium]MBF0151513.1 type II secretion system minor pseudopilin GspI [Magnetococcales bacterium]MBF0631736.1 type II secretion system minor pseudopilin GspI [Magnetococcales bacterium]
MTRWNGFTLLEVMVAMALIGLIFVGIGVIQKQMSDTQYHLEEQLAAAQVAGNLLELFRAEGTPLHPAVLVGEQSMAGRLLPWIREISPMADGDRYEVRIQVGSNTPPLFVERWSWTSF